MTPPGRQSARTTAPRIPAGTRVYAIGDVHGRLDLLEELVATIRADNSGRPAAEVWFILLGDIIDRGPDSAAIVSRCMAFTARTDRFVVLRGNHEAMMADAIGGNLLALSLWLRHGGGPALLSWGVPQAVVDAGASPELLRAARDHVPAEVVEWLAALPLTWGLGDYLFVHAGIRPGCALAEQKTEDLLWIRKEFLESDEDGGFVVVHGHSISDDGVVVRPNRIGIDTGAYRTNVLTALALEGVERWTLATGGQRLSSATPLSVAQ
jgi:serine/threonine protein phosphatase 1